LLWVLRFPQLSKEVGEIRNNQFAMRQVVVVSAARGRCCDEDRTGSYLSLNFFAEPFQAMPFQVRKGVGRYIQIARPRQIDINNLGNFCGPSRQ